MDSYTSDITPPARHTSAAEQRAKDLAAAYARCFSSGDGARVLEDLQRKFSHKRPRFQRAAPTHDPIRAALIDGECAVLSEIEDAIEAGHGIIYSPT